MDLATCNGKLTAEERRVADEMAEDLRRGPEHWKKRTTATHCFVALKTANGDVQVVVSRNTIECWYAKKIEQRGQSEIIVKTGDLICEVCGDNPWTCFHGPPSCR